MYTFQTPAFYLSLHRFGFDNIFLIGANYNSLILPPKNENEILQCPIEIIIFQLFQLRTNTGHLVLIAANCR